MHYCTQGGNNVTILNERANTKKIIYLSKAINSRSESISYLNKIYITGGIPASDEVYELDVATELLTAKEKMLTKKFWHGLCIAANDIYSIGGQSNANQLNFFSDCQKYSITANKWTGLPDLLTPRDACAVFSLNEKEVYAFGGLSYTGNLDSIERINVHAPTKWEYICVSNIISGRYHLQAIQIGVWDVMVFGGNVKNTYRLSLDKNICMPCEMLPIEGGFSFTAPMYDGECIYAVYFNKNVHSYSINSKKWSIIQL